MNPRLLDVFFYGLFMDEQILSDQGVHATDVRLAAVPGFSLHIGARAALVPKSADTVHGVVMKLSQSGKTLLTIGKGPTLTVTGEPPELLLFISGRDAARLTFDGDTETAEAVRAARRGL